MTVLAGAAAAAAWLAASIVVLSEGRRALALGVGLYGVATAATLAGTPALSVPVAAGAVISGLLRLRDGRPGWTIVPPGSTPRLILCIVVGVIGAFVALNLLLGPGPGAARVAVVLGGTMAGSRLLSTARRSAALPAAAVLALALAASAVLIAGPAVPAETYAAALAAVGLGLVPAREEAPARG